MLTIKVRDKPASSKKGDFVLCEVDDRFSPLPGSREGVWTAAGLESIPLPSALSPLEDFEIHVTGAFELPKYSGIFFLKVPTFSSSSSERRTSLEKCYQAILKRAVEKEASKIVIPFVGITSGIPADEGVDVAFRTILQFIHDGNTGRLKQVKFCSFRSPAIKIAVKHELYLKLTGDACIFSIMNLTIEAARSVHIECEGALEKLRKMDGPVQTFGCEHSVDLLLIRGGIQVDWTNIVTSNRILEMSVCTAHKRKLLTNWKSNTFGNKKNKHQKTTCSLPEICHSGGGRPVTEGRISKLDTLRLIQATGRFFHVGTAICTLHLIALREQRFVDFSFADNNVADQEPLSNDFMGEMNHNDSMNMGAMNQSLSEIGSVSQREADSSIDSQSFSVHSLAMSIQPPDGYRDPVEVTQAEQKKKAQEKEAKGLRLLREFASLHGLSRVTADIPYKQLRGEPKTKKIRAMERLVVAVFKQCAGGEEGDDEQWRAMRDDIVKKIGGRVEDERVGKILQSIDERLEETTDPKTRAVLLSVVTGHFKEKEIVSWTGVSRYAIGEAKAFALYGLDEIVNIRRVRFDIPTMSYLANFVSRPEVAVVIPSPARELKLGSGEIISLAAMDRMHSYRNTYNLYMKHMEMKASDICAVTGGDVQEFIRNNTYSFKTVFKILEKILPRRRRRLQCLDQFQAEALESFDSARDCITEVKENGKIDNQQAGDLVRRFRSAQNYLTGYYRMYLSLSSTCSSHCLLFALSHPTDKKFQSACDHEHEESCQQCDDMLSVFVQFKALLIEKRDEAVRDGDIIRFRLKRLVDECMEWEKRAEEYQKHILRAAMCELDRMEIIKGLVDSSALVTMDYSLKLMPSGFIESQNQWYGKAGISLHVSHVLLKRGQSQRHHTLGHLNDDAKQDMVAVCCIADHVFETLAANGVARLVLRSDNAANYRNSGVLNTLRVLAARYGIDLKKHGFSETGAGKGLADNRISHIKAKIRDVVDSGGYGKDAGEILATLAMEPLLKAYSFYQMKINRPEEEVKPSNHIPDITNLGSFSYEEKGIRVKKFDSIGEGKFIPYENMEVVETPYEIVGSVGHLSQTPEFWGEFTDKPAKRTNAKETVEENHDEDDGKKRYRCPVGRCIMKYRTERGLSDHMSSLKHRERKYTDTVVEAAARLISQSVETNEEAYESMQRDIFSSSGSAAPVKKQPVGWAIRVKNQRSIIHPEVRDAVIEYFIQQRSNGKRAEARWVVQMLKNKKKPDGDYAFELKYCLKESQVQGLISRWLKLANSNGLEAVIEERRSHAQRNEEDDGGELSDGAEEVFLPEDEEASKRRGRATKPAAKAARSLSRKSTAKSQQKKKKQTKSDSEEEMEVDDDDDDQPCSSKSVRNPARSKKTSCTSTTRKASCRGKKKQGDEMEEKADDSTTRVLRSRKRGKEEPQPNYCESELSDDGIDNYTAIMNAVQEPDTYTELFTDEE